MQERLEKDEAWPEVRAWRETTQNDRAGALVLNAILEHALEKAIASHFVLKYEEAKRLFVGKEEVALANLSTKITLGYYLGIFPEWIRKDLTILKNIRNSFAHSTAPINFEHPAIQEQCAELSPNKVKFYPSEFLRDIIGQKTLREISSAGRFFYQENKHLGSAAFTEHHKEIEEQTNHAKDFRNLYWISSTILFAYFSSQYSQENPLKYTTSPHYKEVTAFAEPPK
jgi:DNA-binding MltR family transcriptional regulator